LILGPAGTALSIAGLIVVMVDYFGLQLAKHRIDAFGERWLPPWLRVQGEKSRLDSVVQCLLTAGAGVLCTLAGIERNYVYFCLEVMLTASGLLGFCPWSERVNVILRAVITIGTFIVLWAAGLVWGIAWLGVIGLETLGMAFVFRPGKLIRDILMLVGPLFLCLYAGLGLAHEPAFLALHGFWLALNVSFGAFAVIVLYAALRMRMARA
jgi:hypothetical protein